MLEYNFFFTFNLSVIGVIKGGKAMSGDKISSIRNHEISIPTSQETTHKENKITKTAKRPFEEQEKYWTAPRTSLKDRATLTPPSVTTVDKITDKKKEKI